MSLQSGLFRKPPTKYTVLTGTGVRLHIETDAELGAKTADLMDRGIEYAVFKLDSVFLICPPPTWLTDIDVKRL